MNVIVDAEVMYNLTVDRAHTFFVGDHGWLVHNLECDFYNKMSRNLPPGQQAHHLNQNAAYKPVIPEKDGLAVPLDGNAFRDTGSPHYDAHESMEDFWDPYRQSGQRPTNSQYSDALEESLHNAGLPDQDVMDAVEYARMQREAYGLMDDDLVPRVPRQIYQQP